MIQFDQSGPVLNPKVSIVHNMAVLSARSSLNNPRSYFFTIWSNEVIFISIFAAEN